MKDSFITAWSDWKPTRPPFILPGDKAIVSERSGRIQTFQTLHDYIDSPRFNDPDDTDLHLGLYPQPMLGNLANAKVVFLLLNPGLKPGDYFAECENPEFRTALHRSMRQEFRGVEYPFLFLDPAFSWHSGFLWWTKKLRSFLDAAQRKLELSPKQSLQWLAERVASIELYPYHSRKFKLPKRIRNGLRSRSLALKYVQEELVPKAERGAIQLVVMRQAKTWAIKKSARGAILFNGAEARAAHISHRTQAGKSILNFLQLE